jgi:hypothetical protein
VRAGLIVWVLLRATAANAEAPRIDLYTMGAGEELFSAFGHAAICVRQPGERSGRCYNYGTADFRTPLPLTWNFVRGRALFWVSVLEEQSMLRYYEHEDRTVWRQSLSLPPEQAERMAAALLASTDERVKYYRYHHFDDNCTTRIRDVIDSESGGALRRGNVSRGRSFRQWAREGFAGHWPLLAVTELVLGRPSDRITDSWAAMFLPSELRDVVARTLAAPPQVVYARKRPLPDGATWLGHAAFAIAGALLAALLLLGRAVGRRAFRAALLPAGLVLGLVALVLDALAVLSSFPELVRNEALLALWPTDLALPFLSERLLKSYATVRLASLVLVAAAHLVGFTQPLSPLLLVAFPLLTVRGILVKPLNQ